MTPTVIGQHGQLNGRPFYRVRLDSASAEALRVELQDRSLRARSWFTLIATADNPSRMRIKEDPTPEFERHAPPLYLRGDVLRISGSEGKSCNITLSNLAAGELASRIAEAASQMRDWLELRIPSRRRDLIEIIPDKDMEAGAGSGDDRALGLAGLHLAGEVLSSDDFADWNR